MSLIILFAPSFPSLYKSSVFPVSLSSLNVITCVKFVSRDLCCLRVPCFQIKYPERSSSFPVFLAPPVYLCDKYTVDLINNNINRDVQEECANRLYRVYIHSSNTDDENIEEQFIKMSPVNVI